MLLRIAAESPKTAGMSPRNKWIVGLLIVVLVPVQLIGAFLWFHLPRGVSPEFQVLIDRQTESEAEWLALAAAEGVNYSLILQRPPFWNSGNTWIPNLESDTWINYISNQTVTHLLDRADFYRQKGSQVKIRLIRSSVMAGKPRLHAHHLPSLAEVVSKKQKGHERSAHGP